MTGRKKRRIGLDTAREADVHLGIQEADGGVNNGGGVVVGLDLENGTLVAHEDGEETDADILGQQILGKGKRNGLCLAGLDTQVVLRGGQVAQNALVGGGIVGQSLGGVKGASDEGKLDGLLLTVDDLDEGLRGAAVDELDAKDVGIGEGGLDVGLNVCSLGGVEDGLFRLGSSIILRKLRVSDGGERSLGSMALARQLREHVRCAKSYGRNPCD